MNDAIVRKIWKIKMRIDDRYHNKKADEMGSRVETNYLQTGGWISLFLSVGAFNPFTFKVITNMYVPIAIFLVALDLFL